MAPLKNTLIQGDCVELLGKVESGSVDLVFADPPFNIGYEYDVYDDERQAEDYIEWCRKWIDGVYQALKSDGTFWLAIGDEYAAELKIEAQKAGFHCRSWVIWYYTFGVNCANGFSRSHTHLFHFIKNKKKFTFVRPNPNVRVKSARQLVYADNRANPSGRLPDNTWITRPQDAPDAFRPNHDTWFYSRVAGTFKEREGFHGCQMPEQLLARIIRTSSNPYDLVLDPFGGSGTTLSVAKKLRRHWLGFELSEEYATHIKKRLDATNHGDPLDGADDPIESAPNTSKGKLRKEKPFDEETVNAVIESYVTAGKGYPWDYLLCDKDLNKKFIRACLKHGIGGNAIVWNQLLVKLHAAGDLPQPKEQPPEVSTEELNRYDYASEVSWRLVSDEFRTGTDTALSLDQIFCSPDSAEYFDQIAKQYGPQRSRLTSLKFRHAAIQIRKIASEQLEKADPKKLGFASDQLVGIDVDEFVSSTSGYEEPGVYLIAANGVALFAGVAQNLREQVSSILDNPAWQRLDPDCIFVLATDRDVLENYAIKAALVQEKKPLLNCNAWHAKPCESPTPKPLPKKRGRKKTARASKAKTKLLF